MASASGSLPSQFVLVEDDSGELAARGYMIPCRWDGSAAPWIRLHVRLGAGIVHPEPRSLRITSRVGDWERWA